MTALRRLALSLLAATTGCARPAPHGERQAPPTKTVPELHSLLHRPLYADPPGDRARLQADLAAARRRLAEHPDDPDALLWVGRRLGYLWRMNEAVAVFSEGARRFPGDARFLRHRGHRYITLRRFDLAIADLHAAIVLIQGRPDDIEPDGQPNERNIPLTTTGFNVWYHLALAHYLQGDFDSALAAWRTTRRFTRGHDDNIVAITDWEYMTLRRLNRSAEAASLLESIRPEMTIIENRSYHRRLLMYKGLLKPEELLAPAGAKPLDVATQGYGVGNWYLYNGQTERARAIFEEVVAGPIWPAFGFIAAEAELARMGRTSSQR